GLPDAAAARRELAELGTARNQGALPSQGARVMAAAAGSGGAERFSSVPAAGQALLATWHNLLDAGRMQDGEPYLAGTARPTVAKMSAATAAEAGVVAGAKVSVSTSRGAIVVPAEITAMPDRVVWLPANSAGCHVRRDLGAGHGSLVTVRSAE